MAHRIFVNKFAKNLQGVFENANTKSVQRFQNLLVLDFEATCEKDFRLEPQEIIEFPCVVLSTEDWKVKDVFHEYVKPRHHNISPFCSDLTGIVQDTVDSQPHFSKIFAQFSQWLQDGRYFQVFHFIRGLLIVRKIVEYFLL